MKARILLSILIGISLSGVSNAALDWDITGGTEIIQDGDEYSKVSIYNTATVEMSGGAVTGIDTYDSSILTLLNGSVGAWGLYSYDYSVVNVYGWTEGIHIVAIDSSTVNLFQGNTNGSLNPYDSSAVHIYGTDFDFSASGNDGILSGKWTDGTDFSLFLRGQYELPSQINFHQVPEPTSIAFLGFGLLAIRKGTT